MTKRMLIDAAHPEETRVVIVNSNRVEELDFESRHKRQLRGNVYLARVTRVEPSLQAAFIEYGGNRHGFLAFSEIHPDYYKIPEADKQALKAQEEQDQRQAEEEDDKRKAASASRKSRTQSEDEDAFDDDEDDFDDDDAHDDDDMDDERDENLDPDDSDATDESDAEVADEQVKVASNRRKRISRRRYKIQEVIKRGQILLVQAVKEERGNKGAAMTTYLSLAGRYSVLMPNTPRGGGISRKIANGADRKRLKSIMSELEVPQGMGVIVRTAGAKRTKAEIKRDYEYLSRLWSDIRETTMNSTAPSLIHEEGNLVKRSIRDLYNKDIEEVLVQGDDAYKTAKDFIKMLMPSHAKFVKQYNDPIPLFLRYGAEKQIENSLDATVQLKSGGYLVIHPTEALISVDVNSGRSTKERNIERTALKTNLEAAEELARQMRLRDLAGLIVVDFIDMDENKNNRAVERKMKDVLTQDRARIQTSRISQFGLMEISRQRRRRSLLEGSTTSCPHCGGVGRKRTIESSALAAIRAVEDFAVRGKAKRIRLKTSQDVALYLLNEKRDLLTQVDQVADVFTEVVGDDDLIRPNFELEIVEKRDDKRTDPLVKIEQEFQKEREQDKRKPKPQVQDVEDDEDDSETETKTETVSKSDKDENEDGRSSGRRRSRRGRRGGRGRGRRDETAKSDEDTKASDDALEVIAPKADSETETDSKPKRRRRRRNSAKPEDTSQDTQSEETRAPEAKEDSDDKSSSRRRRAPAKTAEPAAKKADAPAEKKPAEAKSTGRSTTRRKAPPRKGDVTKDALAADEKQAETVAATPKRTRKAPVKKAPTKAAETAGEKPKRTRKAPAKAAKAEGAAQTEDAKPARKRRAPAKKADTEVEEKPKRTRKAPVKKADAATEDAPKPAAKRKAPAKKTPAKKAPAKKTATKKAPVEETPVNAAESDAPKAEEKPKRTRKASEKVAPVAEEPKPVQAEVKAEAPAPIAAQTPQPEKTAAPEKKKRGWWARRK